MCKYCELKDEGIEMLNDNQTIVKIEDGSEEILLTLNRYKVEEYNYHINELIIDKGVQLGDGCYTIKDAHIPIKYCPFCGEEL